MLYRSKTIVRTDTCIHSGKTGHEKYKNNEEKIEMLPKWESIIQGCFSKMIGS